ncbi:hypothetical protein RV134_260326 [Roseovarius sp. EC-HK134]|nr:hypothetical protein RV134_260326 [Roseovarius sp. EC-HK134]VVT10991.1 hypothetical protein RV420_290541 [Roseovarius sp. EC-SD190]
MRRDTPPEEAIEMGADPVLGPLPDFMTAFALPIERLTSLCVTYQFGLRCACRENSGQGNEQEAARYHGLSLLTET